MSSLTKYVIRRDGLPPISFQGQEIGSATNGGSESRGRWLEVDIYKTKGGRYIASWTHRTCWQGEHDTRKAKSHLTAADLIEWLKNGEDTLNDVAQEAVERAAKTDTHFAGYWVEEVE